MAKERSADADLAALGVRRSKFCETCRWMRRTPKGAEYLRRLIELHDAGDRRATFSAIVRLAADAHDFPLGVGALKSHYHRQRDGGCDA